MNTQPAHQNMDRQEIHFPNGNRAQAVICPVGTRVTALLHTLDVPRPKIVIMIAGGASQMNGELSSDLVRLFTHSIAQLTSSKDTLIIDGGTQVGVMAIMGQEIAQQQPKP